MADGSIRVETKLDTKGVEKGLEDIDKMCNDTKKHLEEIAQKLKERYKKENCGKLYLNLFL